MTGTSPPFEILLIEDDENDVLVTRESLDETGLPCRLSVAKNGTIALQRLRKESQFADTALPDLVLLDLNLPGKNGQEVLREIKTDDHLKHLPTVVWSTTCEPSEVDNCYKLHANSVLVKPLNFSAHVECLQAIGNYWFGPISLPTKK